MDKEPLVSSSVNGESTSHINDATKADKMKRILAAVMILLAVLFYSFGILFNKLLFQRQINFGVFQFIALRSLAHLFVISIVVNRNMAKIAWASIPGKLFKYLIIRASVISFSFSIVAFAVEYLPLVEIALIINT
jgi:drug/metabolite transporter (DMT)-like permease